MTVDEMNRFDQFLLESFADGVHSRELRLSNHEVEYLRDKYPSAEVRKSITKECSDGKVWYEINLASINEDKSVISKEIAAIQKENLQLKKELENLKKSLALSMKGN